MTNTCEKTIREVYALWKQHAAEEMRNHPDEEEIVLLSEDGFSDYERAKMQAHIVRCHFCAQSFVISLRLKDKDVWEAPLFLIEKTKVLIRRELSCTAVVIMVRAKRIFMALLITQKINNQKYTLDFPLPNVYLSESTIYGTK